MPGTVMLSFCTAKDVAVDFMMAVRAVEHAPDSPVAYDDVKPVKCGPILTVGRNLQARQFLDSECEWLWMLDTDMVFTPATLTSLLHTADPEKYPVVGALCLTTMQGQILPTMYMVGRTPDDKLTFDVVKDFPRDRLVQVGATGCACLLIHRSVFEKLSKHNPDDDKLWFSALIVDGTEFGEDMSFCLRLALAEIPVHVHTGIEVGHLKTVTLGQIAP